MAVFEDTELYRWQRLFPVIGLDRFRRAALAVRYRQQNIIFVRKALHIRPRDQQCVCIVTARREGYAFFDEDDLCAGFQTL